MPEHVKGLAQDTLRFSLCLQSKVSVSHVNGKREFWYIAELQEKPTKSNLAEKRDFFFFNY